VADDRTKEMNMFASERVVTRENPLRLDELIYVQPRRDCVMGYTTWNWACLTNKFSLDYMESVLYKLIPTLFSTNQHLNILGNILTSDKNQKVLHKKAFQSFF